MSSEALADAPRVCYITASYPFGTGESFIEPEILEWEQTGVSVNVVPIYPRGVLRTAARGMCELTSLPLFSLRYVVALVCWLIESPADLYRSFRGLCCAPKKLPKNILAALKALYVARRLREIAPCHIHAHWGGTSSTMALVIGDMLHVPWSLTCHRWDVYENNLLELKSKRADFVRFISERGMIDAVALGVASEKACVIHMGVRKQPEAQPRALASPPRRVICVANLIEVKGIRYLIDAISILKRSKVDLNVSVYGDGPLKNSLVEQVRGLGLASMVTFEGHRPHSDIMACYRNGLVDLLVLPSIQLSTSEHEGIPVALMEAMSFGVPVISTRTGSIEELLPERLGVTVQDRDPRALAAAMFSVLSNPERYAALSQEMLDIVSSSWDTAGSVRRMRELMFERAS